jgi:hypothetical protein
MICDKKPKIAQWLRGHQLVEKQAEGAEMKFSFSRASHENRFKCLVHRPLDGCRAISQSALASKRKQVGVALLTQIA